MDFQKFRQFSSRVETELLNVMSLIPFSVARLEDLVHFGQLFKADGNNYFAQIDHILGNFLKVSKSFFFLAKSFLGNFYRHLAIILVTLIPLVVVRLNSLKRRVSIIELQPR